jgi:TolB-like protein/DNA-binding winged helix-turn-helix (wHTH) protein/Tfp pilus assembly protein PilF
VVGWRAIGREIFLIAEDRPAPRGYRFGVFELDLKSGELRRQGRRVKLQEQPFAVLRLLLEHPGEVVTKEELRNSIWPSNTFVDFDHGLHAAVTRVREALSDSADSPRFVETLPRRGYRFIAPAEEIGAPASPQPEPSLAPQPATANDHRPRRWLRPAAINIGALALLAVIVVGLDLGGIRERLLRPGTRPIRSVAVLPLLNLSGDPNKEYLADGVTDELITDLAQLLDLRVISRTSAMRYKGTTLSATQIGRELNVDALVEGSVALTGQHVRITAQLIDARTDRHLWARSYEQSLDDILIAQSEMSRAIAGEVSAKLSPGHRQLLARTGKLDPQAHEAYLKGRYFLNRGDEPNLRKAIESFHDALERDPQDARSYAGLAECYIGLDDFYAAPMEAMPKAKASASKALELDENLGEAHTALGVVRLLYDWDWRGGEAELRRGIELNPGDSDAHSWYALFLAHMGHNAAALNEIERAQQIDPLSAQVRVNAGWIYFLGRKNDRALAQWRETLELDPQFALSHSSAWVAYLNDASFDRILAQAPRVARPLDDSDTLRLAALSGSYAQSGNRAQAEAYLAQLKAAENSRYVCAYELATAYAVLDNKDEAMNWLRKGYRDRSSCMSDLKTDPRLDSLRSDQRFQDLLHTLHLEG